MQGTAGERLKQLCAEASDEKDPQKFLELITQINDLLEATKTTPTKTDSQAND